MYIFRVLEILKEAQNAQNDIFGPQSDHFGSFFKVFSLFQNFIFQLAAPYTYSFTYFSFVNRPYIFIQNLQTLLLEARGYIISAFLQLKEVINFNNNT